jgi:hypothetical protein
MRRMLQFFLGETCVLRTGAARGGEGLVVIHDARVASDDDDVNATAQGSKRQSGDNEGK